MIELVRVDRDLLKVQLTSVTGESVFAGLSEISLVNTVDGA